MTWPFRLIIIPLLRSTRIHLHCSMFQNHIGFSYSISVCVFTLCPTRLVGAPLPPSLWAHCALMCVYVLQWRLLATRKWHQRMRMLRGVWVPCWRDVAGLAAPPFETRGVDSVSWITGVVSWLLPGVCETARNSAWAHTHTHSQAEKR